MLEEITDHRKIHRLVQSDRYSPHFEFSVDKKSWSLDCI